MSPLEIRLLAYSALAAVIFAAGFHYGDKFKTAEWNAAKVADARVVEKAQADVIAAEAARDKLQSQVEGNHSELIQNGAAVAAAIDDSVRNLEAVARASAVPAPVVHPGQPTGTGASPSGNAGIAASIARVNAAIDRLDTACTHDSAELTSILQLSPAP